MLLITVFAVAFAAWLVTHWLVERAYKKKEGN